jgi:hypothetical protein
MYQKNVFELENNCVCQHPTIRKRTPLNKQTNEQKSNYGI